MTKADSAPVAQVTDYFSYPGTDPLTPAPYPELVFGIVAPAGVAKSLVSSALHHELGQYGYIVEDIRLSALIHLVPGYETVGKSPCDEVERVSSLMDAGNEIRENAELGDALAILAISEIQDRRADLNQREGRSHPAVSSLQLLGRLKTAYIVDSLKHPHEIATLRATYGQAFVLLSVFSEREKRVERLADTIAKSRNDPQGFKRARADAEDLLQRDEKEEHTEYGQNVESCFPKADFFIDLDSPTHTHERQIDRLLQIVFNNPFVTPTRDESGMFHAEAASWRSADLSRQVGASICTTGGDLLALGCNEVPRAYGGLYWEGDQDDHRDFQLQEDTGGEYKRLMVAELIQRLRDHPEISEPSAGLFDNLIEKASSGEDDPTLRGIQALDVLEYGRTVHAEMAALSDAARRGVAVDGATM